MATPRQILAIHGRRPFQPFRLRLAGGTTCEITRPETIGYNRTGRDIAIFDRDDFHLVDMASVEVVELIPLESDPQPGEQL